MRSTAAALVAVWGASTGLSAQSVGSGQAGPRSFLEREHEILLARSAAPPSVSAGADVYVFTADGYVLAARGGSGAACLVSRSWPDSLEPECFDPEGTRTIMPMEMTRTELLHAGVAPEEAERRIADGIADGTFRLPQRMAVVYMMSEGQRLIADDGTPAGKWRPHLMIYSPWLTNEDAGHSTPPGLMGGMVVDSGLPTANLMVVVPEFVAVSGAEERP
ncbi:MAG: hypothetical protein R3E10_07075 [Gemmatimonadota bacterium]